MQVSRYILHALSVHPNQWRVFSTVVQLTIDSPVVEEDNASVVACATFLGGDTTTVRLRSRDNTAKGTVLIISRVHAYFCSIQSGT